MRHSIRQKIFGITTALLVLMIVVTRLSVLNFRELNSQVRALSEYYLPLQQQVASVEILIRQQMVHMERILTGMEAAKPDPAFLAQESKNFDNRGINADQIIDSSLRLLAEAQAAKGIRLDSVTLAVLGQQLPDIQTARQRFHATFRQFQIEATEGTPRTEQIVRAAMLREKDNVDVQIGKVYDLLNKLTQDTAAQAKAEEEPRHSAQLDHHRHCHHLGPDFRLGGNPCPGGVNPASAGRYLAAPRLTLTETLLP